MLRSWDKLKPLNKRAISSLEKWCLGTLITLAKSITLGRRYLRIYHSIPLPRYIIFQMKYDHVFLPKLLRQNLKNIFQTVAKLEN